MIGLTSSTCSPSSVQSRRSTPWVAGWCGPRLIVKSSLSGWRSAPSSRTPWPTRSIVTDCSRSRYGVASGSGARTASSSVPGSVIPARVLVLVEGEQHRLAADGEVAPLRMALVVLWHQDPARVGMAVEQHPEHVEDLALLMVRGREEVDHARHDRVLDRHARLDAEPLEPRAREQLVVDAEPRLLGQVVDAVQAREELVGLLVLVAQVRQHLAHARGSDLEHRLLVLVGRPDHRVLGDRRAYALRDQLQSGRVRQLGSEPPPCPRRRTACASRATAPG